MTEKPPIENAIAKVGSWSQITVRLISKIIPLYVTFGTVFFCQ